MAQDPIAQNIAGVQQLVNSKMNKITAQGEGLAEGVKDEYEDEFTLKKSDEELLKLAKRWENNYRMYEGKIKPRQEANRAYYLGKQAQGSPIVSGEPIAANLIFEAEETFLPSALSKNPEPVVFADNTPEGTAISNSTKTMLQYHADALVLRRKLALMVRHWSIYFLGVMKHGWDEEIEDITTDVIDPQCLILDPDACIDPYGDYTGAYLGERKTCTAEELIDLFPKHKEYITIVVDGRMGTDVVYTEWWSDEYCFYTFKDIVLEKNKNPHFNYDKEEENVDEYGIKTTQNILGKNHFARPKMPYTFLSVFSLGKQPHDITGLIEQNIPNQNLVTKRTGQIDINLSRANNSIGLSANNFDQETAKQAATAMEKGHPILIPGGNMSEAVARFPAPSYPESAFRHLEITKQDLRGIFGTQGITGQRMDENTTARGMILNQSHDTSRIGGGIGDAIEQVADNVFNWWVQLYHVYYDAPHFGAILGATKATEYATLESQNFDRRIIVSVTPDSMAPKDEITQMNQAMNLWSAGAIDPKTLLTMLNIPDPQNTAESTVLWLMDKNAYLQLNFPELAQKLQMLQAPMAPGGAPAPGAPEAPGVQGEPVQPALSQEPASAALSQVPLQ